jgi:hypothetical protein
MTMEHDQLDKMLDEWLERASAERRKTEPRPGFEQRMIARLHNRMARRNLLFRWQSLATAATITVVACMFLAHFTDHRRKQNNLPGKSSDQMRPYATRQSPEEKAANMPHPMRRPAMLIPLHARESLPRQDVFPSIQLSQQDRLLFAYLRAVSSGTVRGIIEEGQDRPIEIGHVEEVPKIEISRIEIEPLTIERLP